MLSRRLALVLSVPLAVLAACGEERIAVTTGDSVDYNRRALHVAVDEFGAEGRSPEAFAELAKGVLALRPGMDRTVAAEAELKLVVLALGAVKSVQAKPMAEQVDILALTLWPTLLSPPIEVDAVLIKRDEKAVVLQPLTGEDARAYLQRLCGGPLVAECKQIVPEFQGAVVATVATRRAMERVRNAVADCVMCSAEPGWHEAVRAWEQLDRTAHGWLHDVELRAHPDNWPIAGNAAENAADLPDMTAIWREAEINTIGEVVIGGQKYGVTTRIDALRELRGDSETITLHLRPETTLAQVKGLLGDARRSGATKVAVIARTPHYPWERRIYWLSEGGPTRAGLRPTDSLQLLLHTIDHIAGPGAVARTD